jgi:hypothetical protein
MIVASSLRTIAIEMLRRVRVIGGETLAELYRLNRIDAPLSNRAPRRVRTRAVKATLRHRYQDYNRCC